MRTAYVCAVYHAVADIRCKNGASVQYRTFTLDCAKRLDNYAAFDVYGVVYKRCRLVDYLHSAIQKPVQNLVFEKIIHYIIAFCITNLQKSVLLAKNALVNAFAYAYFGKRILCAKADERDVFLLHLPDERFDILLFDKRHVKRQHDVYTAVKQCVLLLVRLRFCDTTLFCREIRKFAQNVILRTPPKHFFFAVFGFYKNNIIFIHTILYSFCKKTFHTVT